MRLSMRPTQPALVALTLLILPWASNAYGNNSRNYLLQPTVSVFDDRPADCLPCFNCNLEAFQCAQFSSCNKYDGKCSCPPGFGGGDCSQPVCGSLARGRDRGIRPNEECDCDEGWGGINCNVCKTDEACNPLMSDKTGGVCYQGGVVVKENHQMCDVTNRKILDQLKERKPQITFSCNGGEETCNFQCMFQHKILFFLKY